MARITVMDRENLVREFIRSHRVGDRRIAGPSVEEWVFRFVTIGLNGGRSYEFVIAEEDNIEDVAAPIAKAIGAVVPP